MNCASRHFSTVYCVVCIVAITFGAGACASAQTAPNPTAFEVATVKPSAPFDVVPFDPKSFGPRITQARATYAGMPLKLLTANAYGIKMAQLSGPEWMDSERYDIDARLPEGAATQDAPKMLQALLKERFKLAFHIEQRKEPVYALVVGKSGAKLTPSPADSPDSVLDAPLKPGERYEGEGDRKIKVITNKDGSLTSDTRKGGTRTFKFDSKSMTMHTERSKITMEELAGLLPSMMHEYGPGEHMVADQTGIKGFYQVTLDYPVGISRPNRSAAGGDASNPIPPDPQDSGSIDRSLDALGLKLEKREVLMDVYVVDHVEKPSAN
jgi:uncharacterized protein (TIGR03435 family)